MHIINNCYEEDISISMVEGIVLYLNNKLKIYEYGHVHADPIRIVWENGCIWKLKPQISIIELHNMLNEKHIFFSALTRKSCLDKMIATINFENYMYNVDIAVDNFNAKQSTKKKSTRYVDILSENLDSNDKVSIF